MKTRSFSATFVREARRAFSLVAHEHENIKIPRTLGRVAAAAGRGRGRAACQLRRARLDGTTP